MIIGRGKIGAGVSGSAGCATARKAIAIAHGDLITVGSGPLNPAHEQEAPHHLPAVSGMEQRMGNGQVSSELQSTFDPPRSTVNIFLGQLKFGQCRRSEFGISTWPR